MDCVKENNRTKKEEKQQKKTTYKSCSQGNDRMTTK